MIDDLRYGLRMLARQPGFTATAVLSLALGIAANTTIFSVINGVLLRPLPHHEPERLVMLWEMYREQARSRIDAVTVGNFTDWKDQNRLFAGMGLVGNADPATWTGASEAQRILVQHATPDVFSLLGAKAVLGRTFLDEDLQGGGTRFVILSDAFWKRSFGADPKVVGQTIIVDAAAVTIVGVMPPRFWIFPWADRVDAWRLFNTQGVNVAGNRHNRYLTAVGRLKPGVTLPQAQLELDTISSRLALEYPKTNKGWGVSIHPLHEAFFGGYRSSLLRLLAAVGFVLLIACTNVANLLLVRAAARQREVAIRSSLGAGRFRLIRQWLTESIALSLLSGVVGLLLSFWGIEMFRAIAPPRWYQGTDLSMDGRVLGFTFLVSTLAGILFGLAPALQASRTDLSESLKEAARGSQWSAGKARGSLSLRAVLVPSEVALALILLIGAGLTARSFLRLLQVDPGFNPQNLLTALVFPTGPKYSRVTPRGAGLAAIRRVTPQVESFFRDALERIEKLPGVEAAGMTSALPGRGYQEPREFTIVGRPAPSLREKPATGYTEISPNYFQVMQIPLLKGRNLSDRDNAGAPWVAVVNEAMARQFWPKEDPVGQQVHLSIDQGMEEDRPRQIVGVVGDVRQYPSQEKPDPVLYVSFLQHPIEYPGGRANSHLRKTLVIRTKTDPAGLTAGVRRVVAEIDEDQPVYEVLSAEQLLASSVSPSRFYMRLFGTFATLALILASAGIYGVMSYVVAQRKHEIGVRIALGAHRRDVLRLVLKQGMKLTLAGLAIGLAGSYGLTRFIASQLYGVTPTDPLTFTGVSLLLAAVGVLAIYFPARRAAQVDPMVALRSE